MPNDHITRFTKPTECQRDQRRREFNRTVMYWAIGLLIVGMIAAFATEDSSPARPAQLEEQR